MIYIYIYIYIHIYICVSLSLYIYIHLSLSLSLSISLSVYIYIYIYSIFIKLTIVIVTHIIIKPHHLQARTTTQRVRAHGEILPKVKTPQENLLIYSYCSCFFKPISTIFIYIFIWCFLF